MESLSFLKEIVCLLSCQPRNMKSQLPQALDCLRSALEVAAVGICWMDSNGQLRPRLHRPARFRLDETLCQRITEGDGAGPVSEETGDSHMVVPMKVGGAMVGRLWAVAEPGAISIVPSASSPPWRVTNWLSPWRTLDSMMMCNIWQPAGASCWAG